VAYVSRYIREKRTSKEARIVNAHLRKHPAKVNEFIEAIPPEEQVNNMQLWSRTAGSIFGILAGAVLVSITGPVGAAVVAAAIRNPATAILTGAISAAAIGGRAAGSAVAYEVEDRAVENLDALAKARRI
jgi:hypothetical protein